MLSETHQYHQGKCIFKEVGSFISGLDIELNILTFKGSFWTIKIRLIAVLL